MPRNYLAVTQHGFVREIALDDDATRNSLSEPLCAELIAELKDVSADKGSRAVLLTGTGNVFCSGANFKSLLDSDQPHDRRVDRMLLETFHPLIRLL